MFILASKGPGGQRYVRIAQALRRQGRICRRHIESLGRYEEASFLSYRRILSDWERLDRWPVVVAEFCPAVSNGGTVRRSQPAGTYSPARTELSTDGRRRTITSPEAAGGGQLPRPCLAAKPTGNVLLSDEGAGVAAAGCGRCTEG